jgi:hypothetical protein
MSNVSPRGARADLAHRVDAAKASEQIFSLEGLMRIQAELRTGTHGPAGANLTQTGRVGVALRRQKPWPASTARQARCNLSR